MDGTCNTNEKQNKYISLADTPEEKWPFGAPRHIRVHNTSTGREDLAQDGTRLQAVAIRVKYNKLLRTTKTVESHTHNRHDARRAQAKSDTRNLSILLTPAFRDSTSRVHGDTYLEQCGPRSPRAAMRHTWNVINGRVLLHSRSRPLARQQRRQRFCRRRAALIRHKKIKKLRALRFGSSDITTTNGWTTSKLQVFLLTCCCYLRLPLLFSGKIHTGMALWCHVSSSCNQSTSFCSISSIILYRYMQLKFYFLHTNTNSSTATTTTNTTNILLLVLLPPPLLQGDEGNTWA